MAFANFANIPKVPELRRRLLFTLAMLAVYRIGVFITAPGVDRNVMRSVVQRQSGGLLGMLNLFSGGALENMSIFALGIMPYISSSIIMQLLGTVYKPIDDMRREGEQGRRKLDQYTRYGAVLLSIFQAFGIAMTIEGYNNNDMSGGRFGDVVADPGWGFRLMTIVTLTTGTAFIMWLGEQITERGVSNGISLIIFSGILSDVPSVAFNYVRQHEGRLQPLTIASMIGVIVITIAVVVFFERAQRRIPIVYSRRQVGRRVYGGQTAHLPLRVNSASVIPAIFASSLLMFPATLANFNIIPGLNDIQSVLNKGGWVFNTFYALLIIFFCFFYTAVTVRPVDIAENLKKQQANVPGIRPGKQTAEYIDRVLTRITLGGAIYLACVCLVPNIAGSLYNVAFRFGGTSILIVVGVALDLSSSIESHLITHNYEGLTGPKVSRIRGRQV